MKSWGLACLFVGTLIAYNSYKFNQTRCVALEGKLDTKGLIEFYEKLYFHEEDRKEKLTARSQISFGLIFTFLTVSAYILKVLDFQESKEVSAIIVSMMAIAVLFACISTYFSIKAFWGNEFKIPPEAEDIKNYHTELINYNNEQKKLSSQNRHNKPPHLVDVNSEFLNFMADSYAECATHNSRINMNRSRLVHDSFKSLIAAFFFLSISVFIFVIFDMDASTPRKDFQVIDRHASERLTDISDRVRELTKSVDNLKEVALSMSKNETEKNKVAPIEKTATPKIPERPKVRVVLEDFKGISIEVHDEKGKH